MCATKLTGTLGIPKYSKVLTGPSRKEKDTLRLSKVSIFLLREQNQSSNQDGDGK